MQWERSLETRQLVLCLITVLHTSYDLFFINLTESTADYSPDMLTLTIDPGIMPAPASGSAVVSLIADDLLELTEGFSVEVVPSESFPFNISGFNSLDIDIFDANSKSAVILNTFKSGTSTVLGIKSQRGKKKGWDSIPDSPFCSITALHQLPQPTTRI